MTAPVAPKERPILFSGLMIRAILDGCKTQTRRAVKPQPNWIENSGRWCWPIPKRAQKPGCCTEVVTASREWHEYLPSGCCPYGQVGDRLWVRETWTLSPQDMRARDLAVSYRADAAMSEPHKGADVYGGPGSSLIHMTVGSDLSDYDNGMYGIWRPSIHMPRAASRITLEVTEVRVQRLQDISDEDAIAEGLSVFPGGWTLPHWDHYQESPVAAYREIWGSINGPGSWEANPWVWALSFKVLRGGEK